MAIKKYNLIYNQNFLEAQKNPTILNDYFKLKTEYSLLSVDTRFIIFANRYTYSTIKLIL